MPIYRTYEHRFLFVEQNNAKMSLSSSVAAVRKVVGSTPTADRTVLRFNSRPIMYGAVGSFGHLFVFL